MTVKQLEQIPGFPPLHPERGGQCYYGIFRFYEHYAGGDPLQPDVRAQYGILSPCGQCATPDGATFLERRLRRARDPKILELGRWFARQIAREDHEREVAHPRGVKAEEATVMEGSMIWVVAPAEGEPEAAFQYQPRQPDLVELSRRFQQREGRTPEWVLTAVPLYNKPLKPLERVPIMLRRQHRRHSRQL